MAAHVETLARNQADFQAELDGVRVDYVLPSSDLEVAAAGVVDPRPGANPTIARAAEAASDHRLVWVDIVWPPTDAP